MSLEVTEEVTNRADLFPKITEIHITNFMSIERATLSFDESNIIGIRGYNDSGKSAIQRAIACCLLYQYSTKHKDFIQEGKNFFQVDVCFEDGVIIRYEKHYTGGSLYQMTRNGELLYTNRQQNGSEFLEKIVEVPLEIQRYLGLSTTDDGITLNYGLNTDKQLLVSTSGSENYAALNKILKSEALSRASQLVNQDNNALEGTISTTQAMMIAKERDLAKYRNLSDTLVGQLEYFAEVVSGKEERLDLLNTLESLYVNLDEVVIPEIPEVHSIEIPRILAVEQIISELEGLDIVVPAEIPELDITNLKRIGALDSLLEVTRALDMEVPSDIPAVNMKNIKTLDQLSNLESDLLLLDTPDIPDLAPVNGVNKLTDLLRLITEVEALEEAESILTQCSSETEHLKTVSDDLYREITDCGHKVVKCQNCGELTLA